MKKKTFLQKFVDFYFGRDHSFCKHTNVKVNYVMPVTLIPVTGTCERCGRAVTARLVWKENADWENNNDRR